MTRIIFFASFVLLLGANLSVCQAPAGGPAPEFTLKDISGGSFSVKEQMDGKFTILLFWATWGNDSVEMLDHVARLAERYRADGLRAVGICVENQQMTDSILDRVNKIVREKKISFPVVLDEQLKTFRKYGVVAVPTTFVVDGERKIVFHLPGYPLVGRENFFEFIREKFEGKRDLAVQRRFARQPDKHALRLHNMASMKFGRGELDTAKKYAGEAAAIDTGFIEPLMLLGEIAIEESSLDEASRNVEKALRLAPNSTEARSLSGLIAARRGERSEALEILKNVLSESDTIAIAHCYLGYLYAVTGDREKSDREMKRAAELSQSDYRIPMIRSEICEKFGLPDEAKENRKKARELRRKR